MPPEAAGGANPGELFGEDSARGVGVDENLDAQARGFYFWGAIVARIRQGAKDDVEAGGRLFDGGFGEAGDLEKAAGERGIAPGVESGRGFGLIGGDGGAGLEIGARADRNFDIVEGALGFDDAVPAEGRTGFGERGDFVGKFAAVSPGFEGGEGVAVESETDAEIEDKSDERQDGADTAARAFAAAADFFSD